MSLPYPLSMRRIEPALAIERSLQSPTWLGLSRNTHEPGTGSATIAIDDYDYDAVSDGTLRSLLIARSRRFVRSTFLMESHCELLPIMPI